MEAIEDPQLKLQRASADLLTEFGACLPKYLWRSNKQGPLSQQLRARTHVSEARTTQLIRLLEPFQEFPQLLDTSLHGFLEPLVSAFADYLCNHQSFYFKPIGHDFSHYIPLPRGICRILYTFCKVRGEKVISRFLNNEPKYLDLLIDALKLWTMPPKLPAIDTFATVQVPIIWEEKYIMLLWLSHLMLTPFDLNMVSAVQGDGIYSLDDAHIELPNKVPMVAKNLVNICLQYSGNAGKEREAAQSLLVRIALRPDLQHTGLFQALTEWALSWLSTALTETNDLLVYRLVCSLFFLSGALTSAESAIISPFLDTILRKLRLLTSSSSHASRQIFSSAAVRKQIVRVFRFLVLQEIGNEIKFHRPSQETPSLVEESIDQLFAFLSDNNTSVRLAASKSLSIVMFKLESTPATELVDMVLDSLSEGLLWEDMSTHQVTADSTHQYMPGSRLRCNFTAIDPSWWHGLIFTLAHSIHRHIPSTKQLSRIVSRLIIALRFEQRSSTGASVGESIRDAACFALWSLARRYTTEEFLLIDLSIFNVIELPKKSNSVLQLISHEILVTAILDPSGNVRRAASAALQEIVGRHVNTVIDGISLVQAVDYHAVSLRSKAIREVAVSVARLDECYLYAILDGLIGWRGLGSSDSLSRRYAASTVGFLVAGSDSQFSRKTAVRLCDTLMTFPLLSVEEQHGLLLALAAILNKVGLKSQDGAALGSTLDFRDFTKVVAVLMNIGPVIAHKFTNPNSKPGLLAEATCVFISAVISQSTRQGISAIDNNYHISPKELSQCIELLELSLLHSEEEAVAASSKAASDIFVILTTEQRGNLLSHWMILLTKGQKTDRRNSSNPLGHIAALGAIFHCFLDEADMQKSFRDLIIDVLLQRLEPLYEIEIRVAALQSISRSILTRKFICERIETALMDCLDDYSTDQRGDIGSLIRIEAVVAVGVTLQYDLITDRGQRQVIFAKVCRLASEKLDKVRFYAWQCVQENLIVLSRCDMSFASFHDMGSVCTAEYYSQLLSLWSFEWMREALLQGYVTSAGGGSESLMQTSRAALALRIEQFSSSDVIHLSKHLIVIMQKNISNDRILAPALNVLDFLFDIRVLQTLENEVLLIGSLLELTQKALYKSRNLQKLEVAVRILAHLVMFKSIRENVLRKMCKMLLHPYPMIRSAAADGLYLVSNIQKLKAIRTSDSPNTLKAASHEIESMIGFQST